MPPAKTADTPAKKRAVARVEFSKPQNFYGTMLTAITAGEKTDPVHSAGPSIATPTMYVDYATMWMHIGDEIYPLPHPEVRRFRLAIAAPAPAKESPAK